MKESTTVAGLTPQEIKAKRAVNMQKIYDGDNDEWKFVLSLVRGKMEVYLHKTIDRRQDVLDIISDAIADIYTTRLVFVNSDQLFRNLWSFVKWKRGNYYTRKRNPNRFLLEDNFAYKIDWYLRIREKYWEETTEEERIEIDKWKDEMMEVIRVYYKRLPSEWRDIVESHLIFDNMRDVYQDVKRRTVWNIKEKMTTSLSMLKHLIRHKSVDRPEMLKLFRETMFRLSKKQKHLIRAMVKYQTKEAIIESGEFTLEEYLGGLHVIRNNMRPIDLDPRIGKSTNHSILSAINFFAGEKDEDVQQILEEIVLNENPICEAVDKPSLGKFTYEQYQEAIRLRQEGVFYAEINRRVGGRKNFDWGLFFSKLPKSLTDKFPPYTPMGGRKLTGERKPRTKVT